ncbi:hypothetical protein HYDPIDRAFT_114044 [Hydnomerulius pinastri MD-312]|uniref:Unplaced genomic scaffold scaffold_19, whole genome shotgun sequence n=1 Tax=Hydnomerulius pinastri MD-312 TaxID=994086 RepID=A0A0C9W735_9AGAM|nr:hypothetical protein HYDPIDRAFT_114044 [Hydnomerulius pinastri MD-312]
MQSGSSELCESYAESDDLLAKTQAEVRELEVMEMELAARLDAVRSSLNAKRQEAASLHNRSAPINSIPNEMLLAIFENAVCSQTYHWIPLPVEVAVSRVCRRWRALAVHSPKLWTRICVAPGHDLIPRAHLSRSRELPLDVTFQEMLTSDAGSPGLINYSDVQTSVLASARWQSLSIIDVQEGTFGDIVIALVRGANAYLHQLTSLTVCGRGRSPLVLLTNNVAPNLKFLHANCITLKGYGRDQLKYTVPNLTYLKLTSLPGASIWDQTLFPEFRLFVESLPVLSSLYIEGSSVTFIDGDGDTRVNLPSLRELVLHPNTSSCIHLRRFLSAVDAPNLHRFELVFPRSGDLADAVVASLYDRVTHIPKFPLVKSVRLHNVACHGLVADAYIKPFPSATQISLSHRESAAFSEALLAESPQLLWPEVRCVHVSSFPPGSGVLSDMPIWFSILRARSHALPKAQIQGPMASSTYPDRPAFRELGKRFPINLVNAEEAMWAMWSQM